MSYVQFGPWDDGGAPGISAEFLNPLETFLLSLNSASYDSHISANGSGVMTTTGQIVNGAIQNNPTGVVLNGGAAGTATLWQDCTGAIKRVLIYESGFKTGASNQTIALPVAFTKGCFIRTGFINKIQLMAGGAAQTIAIITSLSATGYGSTTGETTMTGYGFGECRAAFDTIQFPSGDSGAATAFVELVGQ